MGTNGFPSLIFQFNIPLCKPEDEISAKPTERGIVRGNLSWGSPSHPSVRPSVNVSAGMGRLCGCSIGLQPPRGPRQSRRSDCQTQSLAQRTSCQPDNALGQRHETQSLSVGGIGQRERKTLCPKCVEQMTAKCGRRALTHDATRFVPKTDLGTLSRDGAKGTAGDGGSRQTSLQRVMKDCPLVPMAAGPGEDSGGSPPRWSETEEFSYLELFGSLPSLSNSHPTPPPFMTYWIQGPPCNNIL